MARVKSSIPPGLWQKFLMRVAVIVYNNEPIYYKDLVKEVEYNRYIREDYGLVGTIKRTEVYKAIHDLVTWGVIDIDDNGMVRTTSLLDEFIKRGGTF